MTTIKFRRDTSANWTSVNPIPAQGEPCYETDTGKLKIGNGSDNYVTLPYVSDGGGSSGDLPIATATTLGGIKVGNNLSITEDGTLSANGGSAGTTDYTQLENKPQINSVELTGNKTLNDLGIQPKGNYLTALPDNAVTTDTTQTISGGKTFTRSITTTDIFPSGEITFDSTSQYRYINNIDSIAGGYHAQNGYLTFKGDTTLVGDNKLILNGRNGGIKLQADSGKGIDIGSGTNTITLSPDNFVYIDGNLKIRRAYSLLLPNNTDTQNTELTSNSDYLSIKTSNTRTLANGSAVRIEDAGRNPIFKMNYDGSIINGDLATFINTANIDTTYMKWDDTNKKLKVDTAAVAHLAMPSNTVVNLTLGASGTTYTPPSDGWVKFAFWKITKVGFMGIVARMELQNSTSSTGATLNVYIPISRNETFKCYYNVEGSNLLRFYYAEGAVPANT